MGKSLLICLLLSLEIVVHRTISGYFFPNSSHMLVKKIQSVQSYESTKYDVTIKEFCMTSN